jgi:hypothetical protein
MTAHPATCTGCGRLGKPYTYRGEEFDGLTAFHGERFCPSCRNAALEHSATEMDKDAPLDTFSISRCARSMTPPRSGKGRYSLG